ncbi:MAG: dephospho-CoA kinase [Alphaproteobacteria bacterium]|nr:dephospho-CoA kinase [Alphaproteobacteria bacterium]
MKKRKTIILGLTGTIGMGKSTVMRMFEKLSAPCLDADLVAHDVIKNNRTAARQLAKLFPQALEKGTINRKKLAAAISKNPAGLLKLEAIIHPLVIKACRAFIKQHKAKLIVLEVPLLFEAGFDRLCDVTLTVSAKAATQKERVMKRKHMTPAKFRALNSRQFSDKEKRQRADFIIRTDISLPDTRRQVKALWKTLVEESPHA